MAKVKTKSSTDASRKIRPALTPEARENQMISLAVDLAEKQLIEGTASSQVITHYLKLGTMNHKLELEKLKKENELLSEAREILNPKPVAPQAAPPSQQSKKDDGKKTGGENK